MSNLDIIVPVKNEEENILPLIKRTHRVMEKNHLSYSLIFIDDHSEDKTFPTLKALEKKYPIKVFPKQGKPGKAYSIIEGARHAKSDYIVMIDADLQYPPEAIPKML